MSLSPSPLDALPPPGNPWDVSMLLPPAAESPAEPSRALAAEGVRQGPLESALPAAARAPWWRREVRLNFGIVVFIFLEAAVVSLPIGYATQGLRAYELPAWIGFGYCGTVAVAIVGLQLWSFSPWVEEGGLTKLGVATFTAVLVLLLFWPPIGG